MNLRALPSVDLLLRQPQILSLIPDYGRALVVRAAREALTQTRARVRAGDPAPDEAALAAHTRQLLAEWTASTLGRVINATGVILNTNLGRAPLSRAAGRAVAAAAQGYLALEYDLGRGERGSRQGHAERLLKMLTGAEAALVVNNNAAAVMLALAALARGKEVLIARSQLVEIGGGFRVPDVMRQSGAKLAEVGTTNRTRIADFRAAAGPRTGAVLCAHHSNFRIVGFTEEPSLESLVHFAQTRELPVIDDLGSGALLPTERFGLGHEPTVQESVRAGATLTLFSGDKLLGGPQAGIIVGTGPAVEKLRKHPLARAMRADKLCLAALEATLIHYLKGEAEKEIPVWRMIATPLADLERRAAAWRETLGEGEVVEARSAVGGGSLPEETLPTRVLALAPKHPKDFAASLRAGDPPVVARVERNRVVLDPRAVLEDEDEPLVRTLVAAWKDAGASAAAHSKNAGVRS